MIYEEVGDWRSWDSLAYIASLGRVLPLKPLTIWGQLRREERVPKTNGFRVFPRAHDSPGAYWEGKNLLLILSGVI